MKQGAFLDAFKGFEEEWESQGYKSLDPEEARAHLGGRLLVPKDWKTEGPINAALGPPHFMQLVAFLNEPFTTATIEVFLGGLPHAVLTRYRKVFKKEARTIKFCPTMYLEHAGVLATIVVDVSNLQD